MKTSLLSLLLSTGLTLAAGAAYGHGDEPMAAMHGGMVSEAASGTTAELSTAGGMLMLYLHDHAGKPIASQGAMAEATVLTGSEKQVLPLAPSGDNSLMASGAFKAAAGSKALVKVSMPGKSAEMFRFVLK